MDVQTNPATAQNGSAQANGEAAAAEGQGAEAMEPPAKKPKTEVTARSQLPVCSAHVYATRGILVVMSRPHEWS